MIITAFVTPQRNDGQVSEDPNALVCRRDGNGEKGGFVQNRKVCAGQRMVTCAGAVIDTSAQDFLNDPRPLSARLEAILQDGLPATRAIWLDMDMLSQAPWGVRAGHRFRLPDNCHI